MKQPHSPGWNEEASAPDKLLNGSEGVKIAAFWEETKTQNKNT